MGVLKDQILEQIEAVLSEAEQVFNETEPIVDAPGVSPDWVWAKRARCRTRVVAALERIAPSGSAYAFDLERQVNLDNGLIGRLQALRDDVEAGFLRSVEELLHADVFGDFLEMADELLSKGFKDPAAVIAGSVLEEHLRTLCGRHDVPVTNPEGKPRKAESLNADLAKAESYTKLEQKNVTAWLGLRNDAAHGNYTAYDARQVEALIRDIRDFLIRHAA